MNSMKIVSTLLVLIALFFLLECSSSLALQQESDVAALCKKTKQFDLCMTIIYPDTRHYGTDPVRFAKIVLDSDSRVAKEILDALKSLTSDKGKAPVVRQKCGKCFEEYKAIVYTLLSTAKKALDSGKNGRGAAIQAFKDIANDAKVCDDQFPDGDEPFDNMSVQNISMLAVELVQLIVY